MDLLARCHTSPESSPIHQVFSVGLKSAKMEIALAMSEWSPIVLSHLVSDGLPIIPFAVFEAALKRFALLLTHGATVSFILHFEETCGSSLAQLCAVCIKKLQMTVVYGRKKSSSTC